MILIRWSMVRPRVLIYRVVMTRVQDGEDDNDNNVTTEDNAGEEHVIKRIKSTIQKYIFST